MHSAEPSSTEPSRKSHHRRRPELNINTISSNSASMLPDPNSNPISPPQPQIPVIPYKSSQRSLVSYPAAVAAAAAAATTITTTTTTTPTTPTTAATSPPSNSRRHPPISSKGRQAAANRASKLSAQAFRDQDRDVQHAAREPFTTDRDRHWAKDRDVETFLDRLSPVDMSNKENDFPNDLIPDWESQTPDPTSRVRDSHDLSLSPRNVTRDSLLGNMLMSLDQFSMGQMNCVQTGGGQRSMSGFGEVYNDEDGAGRTMTSISRARNAIHGRGHGYSYSSDYEAADDSSRVSSNISRGRRSNSGSTGFQSNLGRINSMREMSNQRNMPGTPASRPLHSRGARGSKSSSTNSIDASGYAQVLGSQRWAHGFGGKPSSSFELERRQSFGTHTHTQTHTQTQTQPQPDDRQQQRQPWHIELSNSLFTNNNNDDDDDDDYNAAPTPTVPVGPRRLPNMPSMPSFPRPEPMGEPLSPVRSINLERKRSNKSSRSTNNTNRLAQIKFNARDAPPPLPTPPAPTVELDSAPAPHVGYEKAKEPVHPAAPNPVSQLKEKPGFFRRMFGGGSKNSVVLALDQSVNSTILSNSTLNSPSGAMDGSPQQPAAQPKPTSNPPSRGSHHSPQALQKKPSSFFRRRKKSVSVTENDPPPLPLSMPSPVTSQLHIPPAPPKKAEMLSPRAEPSPVTSLRKAMDPYLKMSGPSSERATPAYPFDDLSPALGPEVAENRPTERNVRGFSPDYEPDPKATIRTVSSENMMRGGRSPTAETQRLATPTQDVRKQPYSYERTGSFLHDNSDSEESPPQVRKRASQSALDSRSMPPNLSGRSSLAPVQTTQMVSSPSSSTTVRDGKLDRLTQDSTSTNKSDRPSSLQLPIEGALTTDDTKLKTRISAASIPSLNVEDSEPNSNMSTPKPPDEALGPLDEPEFVLGDPTEDDRAKAQKIFEGNEDFIQKEKAASWMGEEGPIRQRTLRAYMDLYDFTGKSIVTSLRDVCNRLILRAETQQVDRILVSFSSRWCDCNPNHGFKSTDVIHTICYSIMLLNTDLHLADIESKMTRSQFIDNTMTTIRQAVSDLASETLDRPGNLPGRGSILGEGRSSVEHERSSFRNSFVKLPMRAGSALGDSPAETDDCGPLVKTPFDGSMRAWESQMEVVLKDTYASIKDERLPLYGAEPQPAQEHHSSGGLSVMSMLKRSPSVLSKAPSENPSIRGRVQESLRAGNSRWASKSRSRPRGFGSVGFSSSRTSFDDGQSLWSPVESSATWSRASLGRTQTSMSMDSFGSHMHRGDYQQSIGFANALGQAIIREDPLGSVPSLASDELKTTQLLEDESLELAGPPWVKEGIVTHKHHLDGVDKKAKDRNWTEVFAVIQKGMVSIFSFSPNKSMNRRQRNAQSLKKGAVVGGGNWQDNATQLGTWSLRLTLASALPSPGYSKQRPHVWALSLPTGAVHLFQVGTPDICREFVTTANYWSARLSTHPLMGGVSNIEYGWGDSIINNPLVTAIKETAGSVAAGTTETATGRQRSGSLAGRSSMHSRAGSFRSGGSFDFGSGQRTASRGGDYGSNKLPGDKATIAEWTPPTQSMRPSNAPEKEQLTTLLNYVKGIEEELHQHNALRSPMLLAFSPRGHNAQKAMANWERRSSYLLREIVKFRTYVDCLQHAEVRKREIWREREVARRAARGSLDLEGYEEAESLYDEAGYRGGDAGSSRGENPAGIVEDGDGGVTLKP